MSQNSSNAADAEELYTLFEKDIVPLYYDRDEAGIPHGWVKVVTGSIKCSILNFSSRRST